jgi:hypothetical protein
MIIRGARRSLRKPQRRKSTKSSRERRLVTALRRLMAEYDQVLTVGWQMSNLCYNLAQDPNNRHAHIMRELRIKWDHAVQWALQDAKKLVDMPSRK